MDVITCLCWDLILTMLIKWSLSIFDIRDWFVIIIRESVNDFVIMTITAIHPARVTWDLDLRF